MMIRPRYFIETKDNLFFAINTYYHPKNKYIAFLRYIPCADGDRELNGTKYKKVSSKEAYEYLKENHPNYLFYWNVENKKMMGVPKEDVLKIHSPILKLREILKSKDKDPYFSKVRLLANIFHEEANIDYDNMGITGSTLAGLQKSETSDIDFIIFGLDNHKKARELYGRLKNDDKSPLNKIEGDFWRKVYHKRIKDNSMSFDEFKWYESRKNNRGLIKGTLFDILSTMNPEDLDIEEDVYYKQIGSMKIRCKISDDSKSFDTPSIYSVSNVEILNGPHINIKKIISFTHTYAGEVKNNEQVIASGVCEEVSHQRDNEKTYNLIIGTTRESINEYIKLENKP